ncbi:hypothetical protein IFM89_035340 [Coptis chinensis]|uniref:Retrotransposon Copia-like N-terminal domain-containing protein n=1 Tax=Coptis chinensis TaxID=261450 RepID=A0A835H2P0_9MAGN|nr:hypothetical protein IFM89_035340 [Coptis chinensis]
MANPLKTGKAASSMTDSGNGEKANLCHVNDDMAKQITSMKLNGQNYLPWAHAVKEELILYQPFSGDVEVQKAQREEFHVALLLYGLDPKYKVFKDQILAGEKLPTSFNAFSRLPRASVEHLTPSAPSEASALISSAENRGGNRSGSRGGGHSGSRELVMAVVVGVVGSWWPWGYFFS